MFMLTHFIIATSFTWSFLPLSAEFFWVSSNKKNPHEGALYKVVLKDFTELSGNHLCQILFFDKVAGLRHKLYLKRDFDTGIFLWKCSSLRTLKELAFWHPPYNFFSYIFLFILDFYTFYIFLLFILDIYRWLQLYLLPLFSFLLWIKHFQFNIIRGYIKETDNIEHGIDVSY